MRPLHKLLHAVKCAQWKCEVVVDFYCADVWADPSAGSVLYRLLQTMRATEASVAACVYRKRGVGDVQVLVAPEQPGEVYDADWCAIGLALFDMRRLKNLPLPWFEFEFSPDGCDIVMGEDLYFCYKAKEAGHRIVADWTIPTYHADSVHLANGVIE